MSISVSEFIVLLEILMYKRFGSVILLTNGILSRITVKHTCQQLTYLQGGVFVLKILIFFSDKLFQIFKDYVCKFCYIVDIMDQDCNSYLFWV